MQDDNLSKLREVTAILARMEESMANISSSHWNMRRDEDANLYVTFDDGEVVKFPTIPFRPYQLKVQKKLFNENVLRQLHSWPRRSGKEVTTFNLIISAAIEKPGLYMMVYPTNVRGRAVLWDGAILMPDGQSIKFIDMIPKRLLAKKPNDQEMKIKLVNGSVIWVVGSDLDVDKLRGTNPRGIVYSEFAFQDPRVFHIMLPVLRQNGGWMISQSTFDGQNHFYHLIKNNENDPLWYCRVESITTLLDEQGNRYITDEMIEEDRRAGMPEYLIQQEYYGNVVVNEETKYFAHAIKALYDDNRIVSGLIMPNSPAYAFYDIGMDDSTAIIIVQFKRVKDYLAPICVGYIENNNRDLRFYVTEIRQFAARYNLVVHSHYFPHDGQKRDFNTGKNSIDFMQEMGERAFIVPRPSSKINAIESMRRKLYITELYKENTVRLLDCLSNYSKEYDDKMGKYKERPVHDWSSHGVDAFQTLTIALDTGMITNNESYETIYYAQA